MPKPMRGYWWYLFFLFALAFIVISAVMLIGGDYEPDMLYQYIGAIVAGVAYIIAFFVLPPFLAKAQAKKFQKMMEEYKKNMPPPDNH